MSPRLPRGRLSLHRETVRSLSAREMAGVAGGTIEFTGDDIVAPEVRPRTNAWTADIEMAVVCGGPFQ